MEAPQEFVDRLHRIFDGRLRIRWSKSLHEFHIEQKVGRAALPPIRIDEGNDDLIRARDGYMFVMSVRTGDRMPCPECHLTLRVPVRDTWEITCGYCQLKGRRRSVVAGFWPLDDTLLDYLRKIDPLRGKQSEQAEEADRHNQFLLASQENDAMAPGYAAFDDNYNRLVGIPQVGYTGKVFTG